MGFSLSRIAAGVALVCSSFVGLTLAPAIAHADESSAEHLFQEGLSAMKRNDYAVACEAFAGSNKADPSPGTQINLAVCFEKQKKWASAWTWFRSAIGLAQQRNQKEREQLAEDSANRLKPQLHYVVVSMKESLPDLVVKRDGNEVTVLLGGKEIPMPIDPGEHTIEVSARGKKSWSSKIKIADNALTDRVEVPKLEAAPVDDKPAAGTGGDTRVIAVSDGSNQRTVGIVIGGAGLLSGIAGLGLFILAKNEESERDKLYEDAKGKTGEEKVAIEESASSHHKAAENNQLISIILGGGAVVLLGVGAVLFFTAPKAPQKAAKPQIVPLLSPSFAGLGLGGSF